jgi:5-(carboxyamino)imidazole ribonucleotide mutase
VKKTKANAVKAPKEKKNSSTAKMKVASVRRSKSKIEISESGVAAIVGIVMGSESDIGFMNQAAEALAKFKIPFEMRVVSAHRTPDLVMAYGGSARSNGLKVIIAGAGGAAHLPGMIAAHTTIPVIGVPIPNTPLQGQDSLYSIVQMPKGVPVATMAIGGAWNAGILAAQILSLANGSESLRVAGELGLYKQEMEDNVAKMDDRLQ